MVSPDHIGLAWHKLNQFSDKILQCVEKKSVFELTKNLMQCLITSEDQSFDKAIAMSKLFQLIYYNFYLDIEIPKMDNIFSEMFNSVILELLKNLSSKDDRQRIL